MVVDGDFGMGVSAALRSIVAALRERHVATVLIDRCSPAIPGHLWLQLARSLDTDEAVIQFDATGLRALRATLARAAERSGRLVIAIDDVDRLPEMDLALVEDLLSHPPGFGLVVIAGVHTSSGAGRYSSQHDRDFLRPQVVGGSARHLSLTPLTRDDLLPFLHALPGTAAASARFADDLVAFTGGRPSYLMPALKSLVDIDPTTLGHLLTSSLTLESLPLSAHVASAVARRLAPLREEVVRFLAALAALAPATTTLAKVAEVTGNLDAYVEDLVRELTESKLVELGIRKGVVTVEPTAPVEAQAALQALPIETRIELRARAARTLERESHPDSDAICAYARNVLAASLPVEEHAVNAVLVAAESLIERSRYETARRMIERLLKRAGSAGVSIPPIALVQLAEAASRAGDFPASSDLLLTATAHAGIDRRTWLSALRRQARDHQAAGSPQDALTIYRYLLHEASLDSFERTRVLIEAGSTYQLIGATDEALATFAAAASLANSTNNEQLAAEAIWHRGYLELDLAETVLAFREFRSAVRHARRSGDSTVLAQTMGALGLGLWHTARPGSGVKWLTRAVDLAKELGNLAWVSALSRQIGWLHFEMGDLPAARKALDESERIDRGFHRMRGLRLVEPQRAVLSALSASGSAAAMSGLETLNDLAQPPVGPEEEALAAFARATLLLYAGDLSRAHEEAMRPFGAQIPAPPMVRLRTLTSIAAICAASVGSVESVDLVLADLRTMPRAAVRLTLFAPIQAYVESIARLIENDWKGAYASAWQAGEAFERTGLILRAATAFDLASRAALQGQLGDKGEIALHRTYALLSGAGISSIPTVGGVCRAADLRKNLRQRGLHLPRPSARQNPPLTERQVEVAVLASRSLSDAAIAAQLQISRRTVTTHMTSILRTTGLRSRLELAGWLNREGIASW